MFKRTFKYPSILDFILPISLYFLYKIGCDEHIFLMILLVTPILRFILAAYWFGIFIGLSLNFFIKQMLLISIAAISTYLWRSGGFTWIFSVYFLITWSLEIFTTFFIKDKK